MKKRLRKKKHLLNLNDIVYSVSISSTWRKILFEDSSGGKFIIDKGNTNSFNKDLIRNIRCNQLKYWVSVVPHSEAKGWEDWDSYLTYFKFEALEFPKVVAFSAN